MTDLFLETDQVIEEIINDAGETTYLIKGRFSVDGRDWEEANIIWSESPQTMCVTNNSVQSVVGQT